MLPDFKMIVWHFDEDITIIPLYDVHLGARECMEKEFREFLKMVEQTPNVYLILGGDLITNSTKSSVSNCFDDTMRPSAQKKLMAELLKPVSDRLLCSVTGNHEARSGRDCDDDPAYDIMCKLDKEHLHRENVAFLKIQFGKRGSGSSRPAYTICVTHGSGGGALTSSAVLRVERFSYVIDNLDCMVVGHSHKPFTTVPGKIYIDPRNECVSVKPFKVISATSWLEYGGYAARKMLLPSTHCLHTLHLKSNKKEMVVTM